MLCRLRAALFDNIGSDRRRDKTFVLLICITRIILGSLKQTTFLSTRTSDCRGGTGLKTVFVDTNTVFNPVPPRQSDVLVDKNVVCFKLPNIIRVIQISKTNVLSRRLSDPMLSKRAARSLHNIRMGKVVVIFNTYDKT